MDIDLKKIIEECIAEYFRDVKDKDKLPLSGEEKYSKQEPGGEMMAVNVASKMYEEEKKV
jgi:hypothetical protein